MEKPQVLIVGINSFLAQAVYRKLQSNYLITGVYHQNEDHIPPDLDTVQVGELDRLKGKCYKYVYLISSYIPESEQNVLNEQLIAANLQLPAKLCRLFPGSRLIFCSSVSVYENVEDSLNISLKSLPCPGSRYPMSKLWGEQIVAKHHSYAILRISSMYGRGMNRRTFIPKIIESALQRKEVIISGKGERLQNYVYVEDVADMLIRAAMIKENKILLGVSQQSYSNVEIAEMVLKEIPGKLIFQGVDNSKPFRYNNAETLKTLGTVNFKKINEGITELIQWIKKQS